MHEISTRSPTTDEQRYINRQCQPDFASMGCLALALGVLPGIAICLVFGWLVGFVAYEIATWAPYVGCLAGTTSFICGMFWYWPEERERRQRARAETTVEEITVKSSRVIQLFCPGSRAPCLVFSLDDNQLLYLQGQWLRRESVYGVPASAGDGHDDYLNLLAPPFAFPSDSFVVTRLPESGHVFGIRVTGNYLPPDDPIDELKREYRFKDCEIIPDIIETTAASLQAEHERRDGGKRSA